MKITPHSEQLITLAQFLGRFCSFQSGTAIALGAWAFV
jgi:hypothetical protein